jgi:hypothetical protein
MSSKNYRGKIHALELYYEEIPPLTKAIENSQSNLDPCLKEPFLYYSNELLKMFDDIIPYEEHPEKNGWWINELESLGVDTNANELNNNKQDNSNLAEAIKHTFIEEYKQTYHQRGSNGSYARLSPHYTINH